MVSAEVTQLIVAGHRTGIIGLNQVLEDVSREYGGKSDDEIISALMQRLSRRNYIAPSAKEAYQVAFLREYKKFVGEPVEDAADSDVIQIRVLGQGCPNCERLVQDLMVLLTEMKISADLEHVRNPLEISRYGIHAMPALVINGQVKATGKVPSKSDLKDWLREVSSDSR